MADEIVSQSLSENPDPPQSKGPSRDDITLSQEQPLPTKLPQSLVDWLARINRRYLALDQENHHDTS